MQRNYANLHTTGSNIYLFDSICNQDILTINKLRASIADAIVAAKNSAAKTLTIYVACPDTVIDERFQPALTDIYNAVQSGVKLNIQDSSEPNSVYVRILESITDVAQMPTPTSSPFRKYMKQH